MQWQVLFFNLYLQTHLCKPLLHKINGQKQTALLSAIAFKILFHNGAVAEFFHREEEIQQHFCYKETFIRLGGRETLTGTRFGDLSAPFTRMEDGNWWRDLWGTPELCTPLILCKTNKSVAASTSSCRVQLTRTTFSKKSFSNLFWYQFPRVNERFLKKQKQRTLLGGFSVASTRHEVSQMLLGTYKCQ